MAKVPASAEPGEATPAPSDEPPARRGRPSRRVLIAIAAILATALVLGVVALSTRGPSEPALGRADVGSIASDVVEKAIEDERAAPATSAVVYQQILPSLVQIQASTPSSSGDTAGLGTRSHRQRERSDPHRVPRGRRRDDDPAVLRRRHAVERPDRLRRPRQRHRGAPSGPPSPADRPGRARRRRPDRRRDVRGGAPPRLRRVADVRCHLRARPHDRLRRTGGACVASSSSMRPSTPATPVARCSTEAAR